jgi:hypothetical protein
MDIATSIILSYFISIAVAQNNSQIQAECLSCVEEKSSVFIKYISIAAVPARYSCRPSCTVKASSYSFIVDYACKKESCMDIESRAISTIYGNIATICDGELKELPTPFDSLQIFIFCASMLLLIAAFALLFWMTNQSMASKGKKSAALKRLQRWNVEELNELKQTETC